MRIPQELVDAVIDCVGATCAGGFVVGQLFQSTIYESERTDLKSLALVSRACNHRARSYLFARCSFVSSGPRAFERLGQCPDALLKYTRVLGVCYTVNPTATLATLRRFISSPLVSVRFYSACIPVELPQLLRSLFPTVRRVTVVASTLSPAIVLNLISLLEHMSELRLQRCHLSTTLEGDDNLPSLPPLEGRLVLHESDPPHSAITSLLSRIPLPLRSLCYKSMGLPSENKLIDACAESLENLEVRMIASCAKSGLTLDLGLCVNLQRLIFFITGHGEDAIIPLSEHLSTLREHRLSNIRLVVVPPPSPQDLEGGLPVKEAWELLDQVLYKLGTRAQGRGETLTFQIASAAASTKQAPVDLLPRFDRIGICEGVTP